MLGKPWDPGNLGSACSSTVGVPGTQVPSRSLVSCRRVCSAHHSVVDSHQPFGSLWQAAGCPLPLAKPCASPQPSYYSIFQICMNNPLNFSIPFYFLRFFVVTMGHGSPLGRGTSISDLRKSLICFISVTLLVSLIKYISLCPQQTREQAALCCLLLMFLDHYTPCLLEPPLPRWSNSVVCAVTESSATSVCWSYGFSEAVLRETADLVLKTPLPFPGFGKDHIFLSHTCCILAPGPSIPATILDLGICVFTLTWLSKPARLEDCCLFPGLLLLLLLLDEKSSGDNLQFVLEFRLFTWKPNTGVSGGFQWVVSHFKCLFFYSIGLG